MSVTTEAKTVPIKNRWTGAVIREAPATSWGAPDLRGADLRGAVLSGAVLSDTTTLPDGASWRRYLEETLPALLDAGGKTLESYRDHWECHDWSNCPIAHGFGARGLTDVPLLLRPRANDFIQLYDAKLIPWAAVQAAIDRQAAEEK
ncbi:MAG TPA: pentapeptide repeat-containing protein [Longimicrobiaceae bacterium]|nr:pentapeptide repeat-containing protein [Longimicrobiaceae bacterium]